MLAGRLGAPFCSVRWLSRRRTTAIRQAPPSTRGDRDQRIEVPTLQPGLALYSTRQLRPVRPMPLLGHQWYGDPAQLAARHLAFASVDACPDSKSQPGSTVNDRGRAAYRPRRSVEMGKEAVACAVDFTTTMEVQFTPDKRVVGFNQRPPATVAEIGGDLGRLGDVGKHHSRQHSIELSRATNPGQELFDLAQDCLGVT